MKNKSYSSQVLGIFIAGCAFLAANSAKAEELRSIAIAQRVNSDPGVTEGIRALKQQMRQSLPTCEFVREPTMQIHLYTARAIRNAAGALTTHRRSYLVTKYASCASVANGITQSLRRGITVKVIVDVDQKDGYDVETPRALSFVSIIDVDE